MSLKPKSLRCINRSFDQNASTRLTGMGENKTPGNQGERIGESLAGVVGFKPFLEIDSSYYTDSSVSIFFTDYMFYHFV